MADEHILVVEDEVEIQDLLRYNLEREGFKVSCVRLGEECLQQVRVDPPDLIILDLMLPGIDGLSVCRELKTDPNTKHIPVVMLTAKGSETDMVVGLELGADDYVPKPFSPRVLIARIRAVLRRAKAAAEEKPVRIDELEIYPNRHEVIAAGKSVALTPTEFRVLCCLASRPGWVFSRAQIAEAVHGEADVVTDRAVDVQILGLRKKLGRCGRYIETVRGVGYRLRKP